MTSLNCASNELGCPCAATHGKTEARREDLSRSKRSCRRRAASSKSCKFRRGEILRRRALLASLETRSRRRRSREREREDASRDARTPRQAYRDDGIDDEPEAKAKLVKRTVAVAAKVRCSDERHGEEKKRMRWRLLRQQTWHPRVRPSVYFSVLMGGNCSIRRWGAKRSRTLKTAARLAPTSSRRRASRPPRSGKFLTTLLNAWPMCRRHLSGREAASLPDDAAVEESSVEVSRRAANQQEAPKQDEEDRRDQTPLPVVTGNSAIDEPAPPSRAAASHTPTSTSIKVKEAPAAHRRKFDRFLVGKLRQQEDTHLHGETESHPPNETTELVQIRRAWSDYGDKAGSGGKDRGLAMHTSVQVNEPPGGSSSQVVDFWWGKLRA